ncbi:BLUF domain-containing protein [Bosea sp. (in: a-proteobacteria)]|uniref:BLUF domain-containing protein n=1 Tax=Bosea sp. (in: a-proteobacteria) TaxID=1871050 RepID=UPI003F723CE3
MSAGPTQAFRAAVAPHWRSGSEVIFQAGAGFCARAGIATSGIGNLTIICREPEASDRVGTATALCRDGSMNTAPLQQLVYTSIYRAGRVDSELQALRVILSVSRRNNLAAGVTGFLIFDRDSFVQVLEGPREALDATMARIAQDDRHRDVAVIDIRPISERVFQAWTMGGCRRTPQQQPIFAAHGIPDRIDRTELSFETVVSLARDLSTQTSAQG